MSLADRLASVEARIQRACDAAGRARESVQLIAVSKTFPVSAVAEAAAAGQVDFGESYAQELRDKPPRLPSGLRWHFIGRLQTNKAKYVAPVAHRVHAMESVAQAEALVKRAPDGQTVHGLVAVHLGGETTKGGVAPHEALDRCAAMDAVAGFSVVGLMTLPPFQADPEDTAPFFEELAHLAQTGRDRGLALDELSMGMSHDFEVAIRCGATWIRVGTALFGARPAQL